MECLGGVGYVEENIMPRVYREAPVNAIWEGSGNVQCLDVLSAHKGR
jgi:putative acyl-CoA dehydrogenase